MSDAQARADDDNVVPTRRKRNPAPLILTTVVGLLAAYYVVLWTTGALQTSTSVAIDGAETSAGGTELVTLQVRVQEVDLTSRTVLADVLPVPHGRLVGDKAGEMTKGLRIQVRSGGGTTSVVTFPGKSVIDPTALSLTLDRGDAAYPLDRPSSRFTFSVEDDRTGASIPFDIELTNAARPWVLSATIGEAAVQQGGMVFPVTLDGHRDALNITLVGFYVLAILLTTLIAVVTIGSAILRDDLQFSNVIWLSATMLSFPALRAAMPGAPPVGTTLDLVVFFPCMCLIAAMLVWTGANLLGRESTLLRRLRLPPAGEGGKAAEGDA